MRWKLWVLTLAGLIAAVSAFAQGFNDLPGLISQVQAAVARVTPLLARIPPGGQPAVTGLASRGNMLISQANAAIARALGGRNQPASVAELSGLLTQLQALENELGRITDLLRDSGFVGRLIVDAGRELDRARQTLAAVPSARAETIFSLAQDALAQARQLARAGQLVEARQFAERCTRLARDLQHLTADRDELRRRIEHVLREIDRLADLAPPAPRAPLRLKLQEADRFARAAREAYLADARADCATQLFEAEKLMVQAEKLAVGKHGVSPYETRNRADERLKAANLTVKQTGRALGANPPPLALKTLSAARRYQARAEDYFARGLYESAQANAHLAQRLATRAGSLRR